MAANTVEMDADSKTRPSRRVGPDGTTRWFRNGVLHRDDGPAVVGIDGNEEWFQDGLRHRENGPAIVLASGFQYWYLHDRLHREDGPAADEGSDGLREWYQHGVLHRLDGPAAIWPRMSQRWYVDGQRHRDDGPAVEGYNGHKEWWLHDRRVTADVFGEYRTLRPEAKDVFMALLVADADHVVALAAARELASL